VTIGQREQARAGLDKGKADLALRTVEENSKIAMEDAKQRTYQGGYNVDKVKEIIGEERSAADAISEWYEGDPERKDSLPWSNPSSIREGTSSFRDTDPSNEAGGSEALRLLHNLSRQVYPWEIDGVEVQQSIPAEIMRRALEAVPIDRNFTGNDTIDVSKVQDWIDREMNERFKPALIAARNYDEVVSDERNKITEARAKRLLEQARTGGYTPPNKAPN
jgi:hypothetical protein